MPSVSSFTDAFLVSATQAAMCAALGMPAYAVDFTRAANAAAARSLMAVGTTDSVTFNEIIVGATFAKISSPASGNIRLTNSAGTDFGRLQLGGTTASFPAIKRNLTSIQARLADDSAFTFIQGKLATHSAFVPGPLVGTGSILIYDSNGIGYNISASPALT